jgi:phage terminase large subunit GpA-like protein
LRGAQGRGRSASCPALEASQTLGSKPFLVGVDVLKRKTANAIAHGPSWRFSHSLFTDFYEQLCSERLVLRDSRGQPVRFWERIPGRRAEALDSVCYTLAVRGLVNIDLTRRENELRKLVCTRTIPTVIRSKWLEGET